MTPPGPAKNSSSPYSKVQWQEICDLGREVDRRLEQLGVRLTMGGEPTYVAAEDLGDPQWSTEALGEAKRLLGTRLLSHLQCRFAPDALLHFGVGKCYPGEALPRWTLGCYWRRDGQPLWRRTDLLVTDGSGERSGVEEACRFIQRLAKELGVAKKCVRRAWEVPGEKGPGKGPAGYVLPLLRARGSKGAAWVSCRWVLPRKRLYLFPGSAPLGLRLPLGTIEWLPEEHLIREFAPAEEEPEGSAPSGMTAPDNSIRVALCAEVRDGVLHLFLPPTSAAENYLDLVTHIETTAEALEQPLRLEGYPPLPAPGLVFFQITPDPGVLEVNTQPAANWPELVGISEVIDEEARACGLTAAKYLPDGRLVGTGGGHHLALGAALPADSPFFRRPDLLRSLVTYWQHHPGLSYAFCGLFVGPTGQAPRVDETLQEHLYELELAFSRIVPGQAVAPAALDRMLQHLLVDLTGSAHRSEFCIDKLWPAGDGWYRLGILELRGFEMFPHPHLDLLLALLIRALVARFWETPYDGEFRRWGTSLHDRFALPHFIAADLGEVAAELQAVGIPFRAEWLAQHLDFRFPRCGQVALGEAELSLRSALEPWPVLGEAVRSGAPSRPVDSSCERLEVRLAAPEPERFAVLCNGRRVPLADAGEGQRVGAVRFKLWPLADVLHPEVPPHVPLRFEVVEAASRRSLGGCIFHGSSPQGKPWRDPPRSAEEALHRREERFVSFSPPAGEVEVPPVRVHSEFPHTLDLRWPEP
jgi:uncharacterized protein (DUF2126 family)